MNSKVKFYFIDVETTESVATEADIINLQSQLGFKLPEGYLDVMREFNGGEGEKKQDNVRKIASANIAVPYVTFWVCGPLVKNTEQRHGLVIGHAERFMRGLIMGNKSSPASAAMEVLNMGIRFFPTPPPQSPASIPQIT